MRCDLHILDSGRYQPWLDLALASAEDQAGAVVHVVPGIPGEIGKARRQALLLGSADYVAWLDDDDTLEPGAVARCVAYLDDHPHVVSVYTDLILIDGDGVEISRTAKLPWSPVAQLVRADCVHHLHVARRHLVEAALDIMGDWPYCSEYVLMAELTRWGPHHRIPVALYRWRQHDLPRARLGVDRDIWRRAVQHAAPLLARARRRGLTQEFQ